MRGFSRSVYDTIGDIDKHSLYASSVCVHLKCSVLTVASVPGFAVLHELPVPHYPR